MAFAFASVLASDQDIGETLALSPVQTDVGRGSSEDVFMGAAIRCDDNVSYFG
jgi:hypothetical protein